MVDWPTMARRTRLSTHSWPDSQPRARSDVLRREKSPQCRPRRTLGVGVPIWDRTPNVWTAVSLRFGTRFVYEAGEDGANVEVVDLAKGVEADASGPVELLQANRDHPPPHGAGMTWTPLIRCSAPTTSGRRPKTSGWDQN